MHLFSDPSGRRRGGRHRHKVDALRGGRSRLLQVVVALRTVLNHSVNVTGFGNKLHVREQATPAAPQGVKKEKSGDDDEGREAKRSKYSRKLDITKHKSGEGECWSFILPTQPVLERLVALLAPHVLIWHVCLRPLHNSREVSDDRRVTNMRWTVQQGSEQ